MCSNHIVPQIGNKWDNMTQGGLRGDFGLSLCENMRRKCGGTTYRKSVNELFARALWSIGWMWIEWLPRSALAAWGACFETLTCDKAICEAIATILQLKAYTRAMRNSSSLSTILEATALGERIEARNIGLWGGLVYTALASKVANRLNYYRVRNEGTGWAAISCSKLVSESYVLMLALPCIEAFTSLWIPPILLWSTLQ